MDAGSRPAEFYKERLSPTRYWARSLFLNAIYHETPVLAWLQECFKNTIMDVYFGYTANIGTHTFYMLMLPLFFWYDNIELGYDIVWVLALGVSFSGIVKDYMCLPRPRAPPVHRISMSKSAAKEYGLPSTHSCNSLSVVLVFYDYYPTNKVVDICCKWLVLTLVSGRLYTGMHGSTDIITGGILGYFSYWVLTIIRSFITRESFSHNAIVTVALLYLIKLNPRPLENCPCFQDTVAFIGVVIGMMWTLWLDNLEVRSIRPLDFYSMPLIQYMYISFMRFLTGVSIIVTWRVLSRQWSNTLGMWITNGISRTNPNPKEVSVPVAIFIRIGIYAGIGIMVLECSPILINLFGF